MSTVDDLIREEGFKPSAYKDHLGWWTIGHGICIDERKGCGITEAESYRIVQNRVAEIELSLRSRIPEWGRIDSGRQSALVQMAYQMGVEGLLKFKKTIALIVAYEFDSAAHEALKSEWAKQTPKRAHRVSQLIRNGE